MKAKRLKTANAKLVGSARQPGPKRRRPSSRGGIGRKRPASVSRRNFGTRAARVPQSGKALVSPNRQPAGGKNKISSASTLRLRIPPLLLETDAPLPAVAGPALPAPSQPIITPSLASAPQPVPSVPSSKNADPAMPKGPPLRSRLSGQPLPRPVTITLYLVAVDGQWLHAQWNLTAETQEQFNRLSIHGHLVLRVFRGVLAANPVQEVKLNPEAHDWFVQVSEPEAAFIAELGYYAGDGAWTRLAVSEVVSTPPSTMARDGAKPLETIPVDQQPPSWEALETGALATGALVSSEPIRFPAVRDEHELATIQPTSGKLEGEPPSLNGRGPDASAMPSAVATSDLLLPWQPPYEPELAELLWIAPEQQPTEDPVSSADLSRQAQPERSGSAVAPGPALPSSQDQVPNSLPSSPAGGMETAGPRQFWFNVNAELVLYGATEPDAVVTLGGRRIKLRPDGSFSCRFALPDGIFSLAAEAASADGQETRRAELGFSRATRYQGEVGEHPQEPGLKPPQAENV